jgi:flagellar hook-basal body complex protein FliE
MVDAISNPLAGAKAYGATKNLLGGGEQSSSIGGASFGDLLGDGLQGAIDTIKNSEKVSADAVTGKANLLDVTQAVSSAKLTLDTVVAVRDNVIEAYQRMMQMPI